MDTKAFLKEIRSIIREEIEYALEKKVKPAQKPTAEVIKHGMSLYKEATQKAAKPAMQKATKKPVQKTSSGNYSSIQDILNETRKTLDENTRYDEEYGGNEYSFTSDSLNAFAADRYGSTRGAIPAGVNEADLAPEVANALTRDYSALMAKIQEKKGR